MRRKKLIFALAISIAVNACLGFQYFNHISRISELTAATNSLTKKVLEASQPPEYYLLDSSGLIDTVIQLNGVGLGMFGPNRIYLMDDPPTATFLSDGETFPFDISDGNFINIVPVFGPDGNVLHPAYYVCDRMNFETCTFNPDKLRFLRPIDGMPTATRQSGA